jgi:hypothetical protein
VTDRAPRDVFRAEQRAALDRETAEALEASLHGHAELGRFNPMDAGFLAVLKAHFGEYPEATCGHSLRDNLRPVRWTPRAPGRLPCSACLGPVPEGGSCDACGWAPATGWREVALPAGEYPTGGLSPPVIMHLRLCDACNDLD